MKQAKYDADILKAAGHLNFKQIEDQVGVRANALDLHLNKLTTEIGKTLIERGIIVEKFST